MQIIEIPIELSPSCMKNYFTTEDYTRSGNVNRESIKETGFPCLLMTVVTVL